MARPIEYNYNLCVEICEQVSLGGNIKAILKTKEEYPSFPTFCTWKRTNEQLFNLYISVHQDKAVALEEEMDIYRDSLLKGEIDSQTYNVLVQTLKWKMAKFYPKVFGEKVDIDHTSKGEKINGISLEQAKELQQKLKDDI